MDLHDKQSSQKKMWIVIGAVIAVLILGAAAYAVMTATAPKKQVTTSKTVQSEEELKKDIFKAKDKLDKAIEQDKIDRQAVQDAIDDHVKRVKLTN